MAVKKGFLALLLILTLISLPSALSQEDENAIFSGWVSEGESFEVSGLNVFVTGGTRGGEGIFLFPQKTIVLEDNKCEMVDRLRVCQSEWEYLIGGKVEVHGDDKQKYYITINVPAPKVSISRSAEDSSIEIGESTRITVTLSNEGSEPATGIKYVETVPPEFTASIPSGLIQQGNTLSWQGSIAAGKDKKFAYTIKANSAFSGNIDSEIIYQTHGAEKTIADSLHMSASSLVNIGQRTEKSSIQFGEEERVYITIDNKRSEELDTDIYVTFPRGLYIVATHFNTSYGDYHTWSGKIAGGESKTFITRIRADEPGMQKINVSIAGLFTDQKRVNQVEIVEIDAGIKDAELYFIPDRIKSGEEATVKVYLKNPNTYAEFKDLDITAESIFFNDTISLNKYKSNEYNEVLIFKIPPQEKGKFTAKAQAEYYAGGKKFSVTAEEQIEVEEKVAVQPEPKINETEPEEQGPEEKKTEDKEKMEKKEYSAVSFTRGIVTKAKDSFLLLFDLRKAVKDAILGEPDE